MNLKEIEKVVGSIQTHLFRNSNSFSVGMLKSHFKGAGLQFKEHQVYAPGDDVRFIDWKLSAKTGTTFVKTFEEERNVEIHIILDITETMFMGYKGVSKLQASLELICLVYLLAEKSKDKVSVIICSHENKILPLAAGQEGIILLISQLGKMGILNDEGKVNLFYSQGIETTKSKLSKLDAREESEKLEKKKMGVLKNLVARGKEVLVLSDLTEISDRETLNKLLYRPNMHCFVMESPLDNANKIPFSLFGKRNGKKQFMRTSTQRNDIEIKGRFKRINVKDRYLENFVREML